jgi:hypothetical protein
MRLKKVIQIIEYANWGLIAGIFIGVIAFVSKAPDNKFIIFEMAIVVPLIMTFFLRKVIINTYLRKTKYPGVFYSVMDKIGLTRNLDIFLSDELLDEIYKPGYTTNEFLNDNNLVTDIGPKKTTLSYPGILVLLGTGILVFAQLRAEPGNRTTLFIAGIGQVVIGIFLWTKIKKHVNDPHPVVKFEENGLYLDNRLISWRNIYDWNYQPGGDNDGAYVIINYYDEDRNIHETIVRLNTMDTDKIDFLLLLIHYKGKFGNDTNPDIL